MMQPHYQRESPKFQQQDQMSLQHMLRAEEQIDSLNQQLNDVRQEYRKTVQQNALLQ